MMAHLSDDLFDESMVKLKRALGIATCAMSATANSEWLDHKPAIEYALWQVQENLCDVIIDVEEAVEFNTEFSKLARVKALFEAARLVERFHDSPVVISPNESFATVIAKAIRQLATTQESDDDIEDDEE
jgi:transcriptional/translational regulatory protein YebC/TACO1